MPYPALPDRRMPYHRDGTVVGLGSNGIFAGLAYYLSGGEMIELNDADYTQLGGYAIQNAVPGVVWFFFPELREVTGYFAEMMNFNVGAYSPVHSIQGSADSTNGLDGTWETASLSKAVVVDAYSWRSGIQPVSFTGAKRVIRIICNDASGNDLQYFFIAHIYGEKAAGQTPDDLIFIDHDTTPGVEFTAPEDFGDRPLGTTVTRQFRVKNASATKTANTINLQCNDADFAISTDNSTWVATINIASLAAGAESSTMYVRNTTPGPGNLLGPRFAEIVALVSSWS